MRVKALNFVILLTESVVITTKSRKPKSEKEHEKIHAMLPILSEWYEHAKTGSTSVFNFPPMRRPSGDRIRQLVEGSTCLLFAYDTRCLVGEFKVSRVRRVSWKEFKNLRTRAFEVGEARYPKQNEWCWVIEFADFRPFERALSEDELRRVFGEVYGKSASMRPLHFTQIVDERLIDTIKTIMLVMYFIKNSKPSAI
jgi:predicted transcriptional regulator